MNNLKLLGLTAGVGSLVLAGTATAAFTGIEIESFDSGYGIGTTYQIYAAVDGGEVDAVYGDADNLLSIEASTSFYQHPYGAHAPPSEALINVFGSLAFDSFVSIGRLNATDDNMLDIGIDWTSFNAGGAITTDNGTWFATPADAQVQAVDGRVLIGQFTVADDADGNAGGVSGIINLQGKDADLTNWNAYGVEFNSVPAPGALALLGLAGVASRRRRK
ncbi:MAG: PEP-CTERM sorting domain-containing protein [Planctomycetes bacterium]|nr:PEP-CTERM sorting domain-containing protein [Planctomycetota bacterium]